MRAEIISIGTELLLGQTLNTNAYFLANELQSLGIESYFQSTVGDNIKWIHFVLEQALKRSDIVITCGGLGPTSDDLTHEAISSYFKARLLLDKKVLSSIKKRFKLRTYKRMPACNIKQAYKPKDAKWIPNKLGTANGVIWKVRNQGLRCIMTFPGVPRELIQMWNDTAKPYLEKVASKNVIYSKTLKFTGIGESALAEKIKRYFSLQNPSVAPYASVGEVKIRITAKAKTIKKAKSLVKPVAKKILRLTKNYYFGEDRQTLEGLVARILTLKKQTLAVAESCTGGLLSKRLTDLPGSSKYIKLNVVTYSNEAKRNLLKVPRHLLTKFGAVSPQVAASMAVGIRALADSDIGISITGIAGPTGGSKAKPVGLVYFGLAKGNHLRTRKVLFGANVTREDIRWLSTQYALNWLLKELKIDN